MGKDTIEKATTKKVGRGRPSTNPGKLMSFRVQPDLQTWLNSQGIKKSDYINNLIRKDMELKLQEKQL